MLKCSRLLWKIRASLTQIASNRLRFVFTIIGVVAGIILYLLGSTLTYSYTQSLIAEYDKFSENSVLIYGTVSDEIISYLHTQFPQWSFTSYYQSDAGMVSEYDMSGIPVSAYTSIYGCEAPATSFAVPSSSSNTMIYNSEMLCGRDFVLDDFINGNPCAVISELTATLLFNGEDPVGQPIHLSLSGDGNITRPFTIVGVCKNTPSEEKHLKRLVKAKYGDDVSVSLSVYVPYSSISNQERQYFSRSSVIFCGDDVETIWSTLNEAFNGYESVSIFSHQSLLDSAEEMNENLNDFILIIMIIILVISGLNIINCMFFSIRERIREIGIRKSCGADGFDIMNQFVFEGCLLVLLGTLGAIGISAIALAVLQVYLNSLVSPLFTVYFSYDIIIKAIALSLLEGIAASIIPAVYASKIQIADAVRFD